MCYLSSPLCFLFINNLPCWRLFANWCFLNLITCVTCFLSIFLIFPILTIIVSFKWDHLPRTLSPFSLTAEVNKFLLFLAWWFIFKRWIYLEFRLVKYFNNYLFKLSNSVQNTIGIFLILPALKFHLLKRSTQVSYNLMNWQAKKFPCQGKAFFFLIFMFVLFPPFPVAVTTLLWGLLELSFT